MDVFPNCCFHTKRSPRLNVTDRLEVLLHTLVTSRLRSRDKLEVQVAPTHKGLNCTCRHPTLALLHTRAQAADATAVPARPLLVRPDCCQVRVELVHDAVGVEPPHARRAVDAVSLGAQVGRLVAAHVGGGVHSFFFNGDPRWRESAYKYDYKSWKFPSI